MCRRFDPVHCYHYKYSMRFHEFNQIDEAMPKWAKAAGGAAALGAAALGLSQKGNDPAPKDPEMVYVQDEPKIKADPSVVREMMSLLKTPLGVALTREARAAGMKGRELSQFLAQCAHESLNFSLMKELGDNNYFKRYDIKYSPERAKRLGNLRPGDGFKYIGRGFIQLTGRENYRRAGKALGLPLEEHPELVEKPEIAAKVAVWFWKHRVQPKVDDYSDTRAVTKPINSGLKALDDRHEKYKAVAQIIGVLNWPSINST